MKAEDTLPFLIEDKFTRSVGVHDAKPVRLEFRRRVNPFHHGLFGNGQDLR
jgi:hypothetical protein